MNSNEKFLKLEQLKDYLKNTENRVEKIFQNFKWCKNFTLKLKNFNCNYQEKSGKVENVIDPNYPETYTGKHTFNFDENDFNIILKTKDENSTILKNLPNKFSDMQIQFSREQKLRIYDYVIEKTGKLTETEIGLISDTRQGDNSNKTLMTFAEIVALRKNIKRRRLKHKVGKNPPLTVTEEIKNLIEIQMNALEEYHSQKFSSKSRTKNEKLNRLQSNEIIEKKLYDKHLQRTKDFLVDRNCKKISLKPNKTERNNQNYIIIQNKSTEYNQIGSCSSTKKEVYKSSKEEYKSQDRKPKQKTKDSSRDRNGKTISLRPNKTERNNQNYNIIIKNKSTEYNQIRKHCSCGKHVVHRRNSKERNKSRDRKLKKLKKLKKLREKYKSKERDSSKKRKKKQKK